MDFGVMRASLTDCFEHESLNNSAVWSGNQHSSRKSAILNSLRWCRMDLKPLLGAKDTWVAFAFMCPVYIITVCRLYVELGCSA